MKALRRITTVLETISTVAFFLLIIIISLQIGYRYFGLSLPWTEELARISLIWSIFLGSIVALIQRDHIRVEILDSYLSDFGLKIYNIIIDILSLIFVSFWSIGAYSTFINNQNISLVTMNFSTGNAFYLPAFMVSILMIILLILRIFSDLLNLKKRGE